jgi:hypothetical protein
MLKKVKLIKNKYFNQWGSGSGKGECRMLKESKINKKIL